MMGTMAVALAMASAAGGLTPADRAAAFKAAGFANHGGQWRTGCDPGSPSYEPGSLEAVGDVNGDGRPEAVVTEGSTACYGNTETSFWLVSRGPTGRWRVVTSAVGIPTLLKTRGAGGWPDIEVGGPGFCFPVLRWNGRAYAQHRFAYDGKACRP